RGSRPLRQLRRPIQRQWPKLRWQAPCLLQPRRTIATEQASGASGEASGQTEGFDFSGIRHARPVPASPSYFSRTPYFNEAYVKLWNLSVKYKLLPLAKKDHLPPVAWRSYKDYGSTVGEEVKLSQYMKALMLAKKLYRIQPALMPVEVADAL